MTTSEIVNASVAGLALLLSLFNTYRAEFRGAETRLSIGPLAQLVGTHIIGITCSFSNDGVASDAINYVSAEEPSLHQIFSPMWISVTFPQWKLKANREEQYTQDAQFSDFSPIVLQPKAKEIRVIWFRGSEDFGVRDYVLKVKAFGASPSDIRAESSVDLTFTDEDIDRVKKHPDQEVNVPVKTWRGIIK